MILNLIILDILFIPFVPGVHLPWSTPIIIFLFFKHFLKIIKTSDFLIYSILSFFAIFSTILFFINMTQLGDAVMRTNSARLVQLILSGLYLVVIRTFLIDKKQLDKYSIAFLLFMIVLYSISLVSPDAYRLLALLWLEDSQLWYLGSEDIIFRFSGIFGDPNNAAYLILIVAFASFSNASLTHIKSIFLIFSILIALVSTKSAGAFIVSSFVLTIFLINKNYATFSHLSISKNLSIYLLYSFVIMALLYNYLGHESNDALERIFTNTSGSESRLDKYPYLLGISLPGLFGEGYILIRESELFAPHSDILRFSYSYGVPSLALFLILFFKNISFSPKSYFIYPAVGAFAFNSLVEEFRVLLIFVLYLGILTGNGTKKGWVFK